MSTLARSTSWPKYVAAGSAVFATALGAAVLAGWLFHVPAPIQVRPDLPPLTRNAATAFLLSGLSLLSLVLDGPRQLVLVCAGLVGALSLLTIAPRRSGNASGRCGECTCRLSR